MEVLGAIELDLFWPSWANGITLPNGATSREILDQCVAERQKLGVKEAA
jgi:hypothetical protein